MLSYVSFHSVSYRWSLTLSQVYTSGHSSLWRQFPPFSQHRFTYVTSLTILIHSHH